MKFDSYTFQTSRNLAAIIDIIKTASYEFKANIDKLDDPFSGLGNYSPDVAVIMTGKNRLGAGPRGWGMQIYVTDLGNSRSVELIALGDGILHKMSGGDFFDLGLSKKFRDKLERKIS